MAPMTQSLSKSIIYAGTFDRVMDAKNRVTIPAAWLGGEVHEFHAIPSPSGECLIVMPPSEFNEMEERINQSGAPATERHTLELLAAIPKQRSQRGPKTRHQASWTWPCRGAQISCCFV